MFYHFGVNFFFIVKEHRIESPAQQAEYIAAFSSLGLAIARLKLLTRRIQNRNKEIIT